MHDGRPINLIHDTMKKAHAADVERYQKAEAESKADPRNKGKRIAMKVALEALKLGAEGRTKERKKAEKK